MSKSKKESLYVLEIVDCPIDIPEVFYVGRTSRPPQVRENEHRRNSVTGTEDKYVFIRELEKDGYAWRMRVIKEIDEADYPPDYERWYVIDYTRKGHDLMNMKHGDKEKRLEIAEQVKNLKIRSVHDVKVERQKAEELKIRAEFERAEALRQKILRQEEYEASQLKIAAEREERARLIKLRKAAERRPTEKNLDSYQKSKKELDDNRFLSSYEYYANFNMSVLEKEQLLLDRYMTVGLTAEEEVKARNNPGLFSLESLIASTEKKIDELKAKIKNNYNRAISIKPEMNYGMPL